MNDRPTLFFSPYCDYCQEVLERIAPAFAGRLVVRTPSAAERKTVTAVPALFLPAEDTGTDKPHLLIGYQIPGWLDQNKEKLDGARASVTDV